MRRSLFHSSLTEPEIFSRLQELVSATPPNYLQSFTYFIQVWIITISNKRQNASKHRQRYPFRRASHGYAEASQHKR